MDLGVASQYTIRWVAKEIYAAKAMISSETRSLDTVDTAQRFGCWMPS